MLAEGEGVLRRGIVKPRGEIVFVDGGRVRYFAGGGVVIDSTADAEYDECWLKAKAFFAAAS